MTVPSRRRWLLPALAASSAAFAAIAAPSASQAAGTQPVAAKVALSCSGSGQLTTGVLTLSGTAPASLAPGESGALAFDTAALSAMNPNIILQVIDPTKPDRISGTVSAQFSATNADPGTVSSSGPTPFGPAFQSQTSGSWQANDLKLGSISAFKPTGTNPIEVHLGKVVANTISTGGTGGTGDGTLPPAPGTIPGQSAPILNTLTCTESAGQAPLAVIPVSTPIVHPTAITSITPTSGPTTGGTQVKVTGVFDPVSTYVFSDGVNLPRSDVFANPVDPETGIASVTVTMPPHAAGKVDLKLVPFGFVSAGSSPDTPADDFTYVGPVVESGPTVIAVAPTTLSSQFGGLLRVRGKNLKTTKYVSIGARKVKPLLIASASDVFVLAPAQPKGSYPVTITTTTGTSPIATKGSVTYR